MDWVPLVTATAGVLSGTGWSRWRMSGRLRQQLLDEADLLNKLPDGAAKAELQTHIERRVRLLIAEQEAHTAAERWNIRWAIAFVVAGLSFIGLLSGDVIHIGSAWVRLPLFAGAFVCATSATTVIANAHESRTQRRWEKRRLAEESGPAEA